jgi:hypothetical protein
MPDKREYRLDAQVYHQLTALLANYWDPEVGGLSCNWLPPDEVINIATEYARQIRIA